MKLFKVGRNISANIKAKTNEMIVNVKVSNINCVNNCDLFAPTTFLIPISRDRFIDKEVERLM